MNYENVNKILKEDWKISENGNFITVGKSSRFESALTICELKHMRVNGDHKKYISKIIRASKDLYETSRSILYEFDNMKGRIKDPDILHLIAQLKKVVNEIKK